jgi:hypothetical protein
MRERPQGKEIQTLLTFDAVLYKWPKRSHQCNAALLPLTSAAGAEKIGNRTEERKDIEWKDE